MKKRFLVPCIFFLFTIVFLSVQSTAVLAQELSIENVFPEEGMTLGGTVPILADLNSDSESVDWRVYDTGGTLDQSGSGTSICLYWNTRLVTNGNDTIIIEAWDEIQFATTQINILTDPELYTNPNVTQLSSNPPDVEKMFCGGNLHRGSERVAPNKKGSIVAFISNAYSDIPHPLPNKMPVCQNCELFTNTYNGTNLIQWTSNPSDQINWKMERVDVDDSGKYIVFTSSADLLGTNPLGMQQIYYLNARTEILHQLTFFMEGEGAERSSISGDGHWIAFNSNTNQLGTNPDKLKQVFVIHRSGSSLTQLTFGTDGEVRAPVISGDGRTIAFGSSHNLTGENPNSVYQIFVIQRDGTGLRQLTFSKGRHSSRPAINRDGTKVVFLYHKNKPLEGPIGLGADIFSMNTDGTGLFRYTKISNFDVQLRPDISEDGRVIAWESTANLENKNPDNSREIYVSPVNHRQFRQITDFNSWQQRRWRNVLCQRPYLNEKGSMVYFECTADLTEENPDLWLQVFSAPTNNNL